MDAGEALVAYSESQDFDREESKKSFALDQSHPINYFNHNDTYSDIYFDKSCLNMDDISDLNMSNMHKEIHLNEDDSSHHNLFLRPRLPDQIIHRQASLSALKSFCAVVSDLDENDLEELPPGEFQTASPVPDEDQPQQPPTADNSHNTQLPPLTQLSPVLKGNRQNISGGGPREQSREKDDGKLVFKITRYNRVTRKEKLITKNRRIISKCQHTSLKYYAKGMCKKCYHNFGREKKAFVCGHNDRPLYAKGF